MPDCPGVHKGMIDHEDAPAAPGLLDQILCQGHWSAKGFSTSTCLPACSAARASL